MTEEEAKEAGDRLHKLIDDADPAEMEAIISTLPNVQQVTMLLNEAASRADGLNEDEAIIAATFVTHKKSGQNFGISVQPVSLEAIAAFERDAASHMGGGTTH